jgi:hypothetical protein
MARAETLRVKDCSVKSAPLNRALLRQAGQVSLFFGEL